MADDRILQEAISAIENGQKARARDLLTRLLRQDQGKVDYWLYMSAVVDTAKERIFCLENALKYDPENETAMRGLVMLGSMQPSEDQVSIRPISEREWELADILEGEGTAARKSAERTKVSVGQILSLAMIIMHRYV